jgi:tellurite resistance protein TerC
LILGGVALIDRFHFVFYLFGALLLWSGFKLLQEKKQNFSKGFFYKLFHRLLPVSRLKSQGDFFVKTEGGWKVTNLFLVLLAIECADIVFALDSVPAIFAITTDPFIVYTSNVFAILGLRAMHFLLSPSLEKLKFLKKGLAAITIFIGIKMLISSVVSIPLGISLAVIVLILGITVLTSLKGALAKPQ